jgi:hypothetical protein
MTHAYSVLLAGIERNPHLVDHALVADQVTQGSRPDRVDIRVHPERFLVAALPGVGLVFDAREVTSISLGLFSKLFLDSFLARKTSRHGWSGQWSSSKETPLNEYQDEHHQEKRLMGA